MILKQVKQNGVEVMAIITILLAGMAISMFAGATSQYIAAPQDGTPLFNTIYQHLFGGHISIASQITSIILLLIETFMIIFLNSNFEFTRAKPSMFMIVYIPAALSLIPCNTLLPEQIANIFIALGLIKMFSCHGMDNATFPVFDSGLLFGIATLFCLPAAAMLAVGIVAMIIFRPLKGNELMVFLLGFATPILFYTAIYYLAEGNISELADYISGRFSTAMPHAGRTTTLATLAHIAIIALASVMIIGEYPKFNLVSSQSYKVMFIMYISMVILCQTPYFGVQILRMGTIPLAMMYVTVFQDLKRTAWLESLFYLFLIVYMGVHALWYMGI